MDQDAFKIDKDLLTEGDHHLADLYLDLLQEEREVFQDRVILLQEVHLPLAREDEVYQDRQVQSTKEAKEDPLVKADRGLDNFFLQTENS